MIRTIIIDLLNSFVSSADSSWCENKEACNNQGICLEGNNTSVYPYTCQCNDRFTGRTCEIGKRYEMFSLVDLFSLETTAVAVLVLVGIAVVVVYNTRRLQ